MTKLLIDKQIGNSWWEEGITADGVKQFLNDFSDEDNSLEIVIDSPGGSVFEGISIFNIIRDFMRENPDVSVSTYIQGMAASMASVIALAAKSVKPDSVVKCEDNSVFMIHNSWCSISGNHIDLEKQADVLKGIDGIARRTYCSVTGLSTKEIEKLMDDESFFFGEEIKEKGFADVVIADTSNSDDVPESKADAVLSCKAEFMRAMDSLKSDDERASYKKAAACLKLSASGDLNVNNGLSSKVSSKNINAEKSAKTEESPMTLEELKASSPELYAQVFQLGKEAGVNEEHDRVEGHLKMGETAGCLDVAADFIRQGSPVADTSVQTTYFEKRVANANVVAREEENVQPLATPVNQEEDKSVLMMKGFEKATGLKD